MKDFGFMLVCTKCVKELELEGKPSIGGEGGRCILCRGEKDLMEVRATIPDDYRPDMWRTTNRPEGEPWWMTGNLDSVAKR